MLGGQRRRSARRRLDRTAPGTRRELHAGGGCDSQREPREKRVRVGDRRSRPGMGLGQQLLRSARRDGARRARHPHTVLGALRAVHRRSSGAHLRVRALLGRRGRLLGLGPRLASERARWAAVGRPRGRIEARMRPRWGRPRVLRGGQHHGSGGALRLRDLHDGTARPSRRTGRRPVRDAPRELCGARARRSVLLGKRTHG